MRSINCYCYYYYFLHHFCLELSCRQAVFWEAAELPDLFKYHLRLMQRIHFFFLLNLSQGAARSLELMVLFYGSLSRKGPLMGPGNKTW